MTLFLAALFFAGLALTAYGIWEQIHVYRVRHTVRATIVSYKYKGSSNAVVLAANAVSGSKHPVVSFTREDDGETCLLPLHDSVPYGLDRRSFPELQIGGEVSVMYFGDKPKEGFLTDHPLAQKPLACSTLLLIGLALMGGVIASLTLAMWLG